MTILTVFQAIRDRFDAEVAVPNDLRVVHDNAPEPVDVVGSWCRLVVQVDSTNQVSMGLRRYRSIGSATASLYAPISKGDDVLLGLADAIVAAFRGVTIGSPEVSFTPAPVILGPGVRSDGWATRTVRIPFRSDEVG